MNERVRNLNGIIHEIQRRSFLPLRSLDIAHMMEDSLLGGCSSNGIRFDRPKGVERLNNVFQNYINSVESDLM